MDSALRSKLDAIEAGSAPPPGTLFTTLPWGWAMAQGLVPGEGLIVEGRTITAGGSFRALWPPGTVYPWPTADQTLRLVSSSANDDAAPATGANTVRLWWLDANGTETTTDVELNGAAMVDSAAVTARRLNRARVVTCGTTGWNEGNISIYATDGATLLGYIPLGCNCTCQAIQTVPKGKKDALFHGSMGRETNVVTLAARASPAAAFTARWITDARVDDDGRTLPTEFPCPVILAAGTDYYLFVYNNTTVHQGAVVGFRIPA